MCTGTSGFAKELNGTNGTLGPLFKLLRFKLNCHFLYPGFIHIQCLEYLFMCICGVGDVFVASLLLPSVQILKENSRIPTAAFRKRGTVRCGLKSAAVKT